MSIAVVLAGSFTYGNEHGRTLLTPGSLLLGTADGCFTCGHEHGEGDRCLAFHFEPSFFEEVAAFAGARRTGFGRNSLPALRTLAPLVARATIGTLAARGSVTPSSFEELALELAGAALRESGEHRLPRISKRDERRVAAAARFMQERFAEPCALGHLARLAGLSPFHFLRVFRATTGPLHINICCDTIRAAASNLACGDASVTDIALSVGFEDLSNFTRSFRGSITSARYNIAPAFKPGQSQPLERAMRAASIRLVTPSLPITSDR